MTGFITECILSPARLPAVVTGNPADNHRCKRSVSSRRVVLSY